MNGSDQPAKAHLSHDELHALECVFGARPIIEQEENSGYDLDRKKKERHSPEVVPDRVTVKWNLLLTGEIHNNIKSQPFVEPSPEGIVRRSVHGSAFRDDDVVTAEIHYILLQWARRWAGDVLPIDVIVTVVTGTPDMSHVGTVLNRAI